MCTTQYCILLHGTIQYCKILYYTIQYSTLQYNTVQYSTIQYKHYYTVPLHTIQYLILYRVSHKTISLSLLFSASCACKVHPLFCLFSINQFIYIDATNHTLISLSGKNALFEFFFVGFNILVLLHFCYNIYMSNIEIGIVASVELTSLHIYKINL